VLSKNSKRSVNLAHIEYKVSYHKASSGQSLSLIDRGANGGVAGTDVCVIFKTGRIVDIRGIDNHQCNIDIGTVGGVIQTQKDLLLVSCINMHYSIKGPLFTLHISLSGTRMMSMTSQSTPQEVYNADSVKGKGRMNCYWCSPKTEGDNLVVSRKSQISLNPSHQGSLKESNDFKKNEMQRLVDWMAEIFEKMLIEIVSNRMEMEEDVSEITSCSNLFNSPRDEVFEMIVIPRKRGPRHLPKPVTSSIQEQLEKYIASIGSLYRNNPFPSFEHACHVVMATKKLLLSVVKLTTKTT
jgi:hypothetical protein